MAKPHRCDHQHIRLACRLSALGDLAGEPLCKSRACARALDLLEFLAVQHYFTIAALC